MSSGSYGGLDAKITLAQDTRVVIFAADWHKEIVDMLVADALGELERLGVEDVEVIRVPGSYELPQAVAMYLNPDLPDEDEEAGRVMPDGIICFGVVVQGETPHFTFISNAVADNLERLACDYASVPIMFGLLTTNTEEQALERANGVNSRKGIEVAQSLGRMMDFVQGLE